MDGTILGAVLIEQQIGPRKVVIVPVGRQDPPTIVLGGHRLQHAADWLPLWKDARTIKMRSGAPDRKLHEGVNDSNWMSGKSGS